MLFGNKCCKCKQGACFLCQQSVFKPSTAGVLSRTILPHGSNVFQLGCQAYYLLSARELMRINGRSKAPIVQHMADTIAGSVTIRAFEKDADFMRKALALVDCNSNPFLHSMAATEWLVLRVELLAAVVLASSAVAMVVYRDYISPGRLSCSTQLVLLILPRVPTCEHS